MIYLGDGDFPTTGRRVQNGGGGGVNETLENIGSIVSTGSRAITDILDTAGRFIESVTDPQGQAPVVETSTQIQQTTPQLQQQSNIDLIRLLPIVIGVLILLRK